MTGRLYFWNIKWNEKLKLTINRNIFWFWDEFPCHRQFSDKPWCPPRGLYLRSKNAYESMLKFAEDAKKYFEHTHGQKQDGKLRHTFPMNRYWGWLKQNQYTLKSTQLWACCWFCQKDRLCWVWVWCLGAFSFIFCGFKHIIKSRSRFAVATEYKLLVACEIKIINSLFNILHTRIMLVRKLPMTGEFISKSENIPINR